MFDINIKSIENIKSTTFYFSRDPRFSLVD